MAAASVREDGASKEVGDHGYVLKKQRLQMAGRVRMRIREKGIKNV